MTASVGPERVLVTGSAGQLGSALLCLLGGQAVGVDLPEFDLTNRKAVHAAIESHRPHVVVNTAAFTQVDFAERESETCRAVNVQGVQNLVDACRRSAARIVQISTDYVFDGQQNRPYTESDSPNPLNTYGQTKWEAEQIVAQHSDHLIVRTAGLFGPKGLKPTRNFFDTMLVLAMSRVPLRVVDDQITSFTYTRDLAEAIKTLLTTQARGIFHVANSGHASWFRFAKEIFRVSGLSPQLEPVTMNDYPCDAKRPQYSALDTGKYAALAGAFPMQSWQEALTAYFDWRRTE